MRTPVKLATGAEMRTAGGGPMAVIGVDGGGRSEVEGTWSASLEWLVDRLAPRFPDLRFAEVRYRIKSWQRLDLCVDDARAAIDMIAPSRTLMLGFSMGGAVSVKLGSDATVAGVLGLAPWLPPQLDLSPLRGKRLAIIHGALDGPLPGIPGVTAASSRRAADRARAEDVETTYTVIRGALHGVAVRSPFGRPLALPRATAWLRLVEAELERFRQTARS